METTICASQSFLGGPFRIFWDDRSLYPLRARLSGRTGPKFSVRSVHFRDSGIDTGYRLKVLHLTSSNLGLLFTSMGAGSVVSAMLIIPRLRARLSPDRLTLLANLLLVLVYVLLALVRQTELFFVVAALAGVGWTLAASELWVAAQRAMPDQARGRLTATVIMISQGATALGGLIWGSSERQYSK